MPTSITLLLATEIIAGITVGQVLWAIASTFVMRALSPKPKTQQFPSAGDPGRTLTFAEAAPDWQVIYGRTRVGGRYAFRATTSSTENRMAQQEHVIPKTAPHTILVTPAGSFVANQSVYSLREVADNLTYTLFTKVAGAPAAGEYSVANGLYTFNAASAGENVQITFEKKVVGTGQRNNRLHLVIVFAAHEVEEIGDIYFNDELVTLDADGNATGKYSGHVYVGKHLGTDTQAADSSLMGEAPGKWGANHRLRGHAYIYVRLIRNRDLFPGDVPNITAVIKGRKVYDPRTAATVWSDNAALCQADYLTNARFGLGADYADEIDDAVLTATANVCDEEVSVAGRTATFTANAATDAITIPAKSVLLTSGLGIRVATTGTLPAGLSAGTTYYAIPFSGDSFQLAASLVNARAGTAINITSAGTGTHTLTHHVEARYTLNGVISTAEAPQSIIERMLTATAGRQVYAGGTWRIHAAAYATPTVTLDEGDMRGPVKVSTLLPRRDACNGVKGLFVNPDDKWQATDFPPIDSDTYLAQDGNERIWREIELPFTHSQPGAKRLAKIELLRARQQITVQLPCKITAYDIVPPDNFMLTLSKFGWTSKVFEDIEAKLVFENDTLGVDIVGRETASAVFDWSFNEESNKDPAPDTRLPSRFHVMRPGEPGVIESLYQTREGGGLKVMATVSWEESPDDQAWRYNLQWKLKSAERWTFEQFLDGTTFDVEDLQPGRWQFRVRAISSLGIKSLWSESEVEIRGLSARPASVAGLTLQAMGGLAVLGWDLHSDLDVRQGGRILFRHQSVLSGAVWTQATTIGKAAPGHVTTWNLPLKRGTYLAKAVDASGIKSAAASSISTKQASIHAFTTVATITE